MFFCFILLYETQRRASCQHIFTFVRFVGTQKLGEGKRRVALTMCWADVTLLNAHARMRAVDLIRKKRDSGEHSREEINFLISGYTRGEIPDYQMSAWL